MSAIRDLIVSAAVGLTECRHLEPKRLCAGVLWCIRCGAWGEYQAVGTCGIDARIDLTWHYPLTHNAIEVLAHRL